MEKKLKLLRAEEKDIRKMLSENITKQKVLIIEIYKKETGFDIGTKVKLGNGKTGVINDIIARCSSAEPNVKLYKKDGTLGQRIVRVWSFDKIDRLS